MRVRQRHRSGGVREHPPPPPRAGALRQQHARRTNHTTITRSHSQCRNRTPAFQSGINYRRSFIQGGR